MGVSEQQARVSIRHPTVHQVSVLWLGGEGEGEGEVDKIFGFASEYETLE